MRHALVDQPCFFHTGNHVDGKAQQLAATFQEHVAVARIAQGLRGDGAHLAALETCQPFAEACQAGPATLHGLFGQVALFVQPIALTNDFLVVLGALNLTVVKLSDFEAKAVGS